MPPYCPNYRRSPHLSKEKIQHFKHEICSCSLLSWFIFAIVDPDSGSGSATLLVTDGFFCKPIKSNRYGTVIWGNTVLGV
jgi:hypothetical protein